MPQAAVVAVGTASVTRDIFKRVVQGAGANAYSTGVTALIQLCSVPLLLGSWGATLYGEWLVLVALPVYLAAMDFGVCQSAGTDITIRRSRGDMEGAQAVFQSAIVLVLGVTVAAFLLVTILLAVVPLESWLGLTTVSAPRQVLGLMAAGALSALPAGLAAAGFRAGGEYAIHTALNASLRLGEQASIWAVAVWGGTPLAAAAAFCAVRATGVFGLCLLSVVRHQWLRWGVAQARWAELRRLLKPALANIAFPLASAMHVQGILVLIGASLGAAAVVAFSTLRTLTRLVLLVSMTVSNAAEPELASAYGTGNRNLMHSIFQHVLSTSVWMAITAAATLAASATWVLSVWTGGTERMDRLILLLLMVSALGKVVWYAALTALRSANRHLHVTVAFLTGVCLAVGCTAAAIRVGGQAMSVAVSLLVFDLAFAAYCLRAARVVLMLGEAASLQRALNPLPIARRLVARERTS